MSNRLLYIIPVPVCFMLAGPAVTLWLSPEQQREGTRLSTLLGVLFVAAGVAFYGWCARVLVVLGAGTPSPLRPTMHLVAAGPYRWLRNPVFLSFSTTLLGEVLILPATPMVIYALLFHAAMFLFVDLYEEPDMERRFGEDYRRYCETVPRWVPLPREAQREPR